MDEWTTLPEPVDCQRLWHSGDNGRLVGLVIRGHPYGEETLIGDVNRRGGVCGCCDCAGDVVAYRRVWGDGSRDAELFASLARAGAEGAGGPS